MSNRNSSEIKKNNNSKSDKTKALRVVLAITTVLSVLMIMSVFVCLALEQKTACICCAAFLGGFGVTSLILLIIVVSLDSNKYTLNPFIKDVSEIVESYKSNESFCKIVENYVEKCSINIFILEFTFLPISLKKDNNSKQVLYKLDNVSNVFAEDVVITDYIKFANGFTQDIIDKNSADVNYAYLLRNYTGAPVYNWIKPEIKEPFSNAYNLFLALYHQNVIDVKSTINDAYYAFLFLIYMSMKNYFCKTAKNVLESYGVSNNDEIGTIIDTLYNNDFDEQKIAFYILSANSEKCNYLDIWNEEIGKLKQIVSGRIRFIREKEKIQRLSEQNQKQESVKFDINDIDLMSGSQFEWFVSYLFNKLGYSAEITKASGDQGIDVIAKKGKAVVAIQAKCYSKPVGNHAIMEAVAGAKYYNATKTMVVTNNGFTKSARELAQVNGVILWDRAVLKEKMYEINT